MTTENTQDIDTLNQQQKEYEAWVAIWSFANKSIIGDEATIDFKTFFEAGKDIFKVEVLKRID